MESIPPVRPHILRTIILEGRQGAEPDVFEYLFEQHGRSLQRFELRDLQDTPLVALSLLYRAPQLQYLTLLTNSAAKDEVVCAALDERLPSTCIEITLDPLDCTPATAIGFIQQRSRGPLKILDIGVKHGSGSESQWQEVQDTAWGLGIAFYF